MAPLALVLRERAGGDGHFERQWVGCSSIYETATCSAYLIFESMVNRAPHPRPLSPEYQGEGRRSLWRSSYHVEAWTLTRRLPSRLRRRSRVKRLDVRQLALVVGRREQIPLIVGRVDPDLHIAARLDFLRDEFRTIAAIKTHDDRIN